MKMIRIPARLYLFLSTALLLLTGPGTAAGANQSWDPYEYGYAVGSTDPNVEQDFTVPAGFRGRLSLQVEGADGGNSRATYTTDSGNITAFGEGGSRARVSANFYVGTSTYAIPGGSTLRFIVGRKGESGNERIFLGFSFPDSEANNGRAAAARSSMPQTQLLPPASFRI